MWRTAVFVSCATLLVAAATGTAQSAFKTAGVVESTAGGFRFPDGSLQLTAAEGAPIQNVLRVSPSGGDFPSILDAIASLVLPSASNPYLILVGPGVYEEAAVVPVQAGVHLRGAGPGTTVITADRPGPALAASYATVWLIDGGRISDLTIRNTGGDDQYAVGLYSQSATRKAVMDNVVVEVTGGVDAGWAVVLRDAEPIILRSTLRASGADLSSSALVVTNISGALPRPWIVSSFLNGGDGTDEACAGTSSTGYALQVDEALPEILDTVVCGSYRALQVSDSSTVVDIRGSLLRVGAAAGSSLIHLSSGAPVVRIATSGVFYPGTSVKTGSGTLGCVHSFKSDYSAASSACG